MKKFLTFWAYDFKKINHRMVSEVQEDVFSAIGYETCEDKDI